MRLQHRPGRRLTAQVRAALQKLRFGMLRSGLVFPNAGGRKFEYNFNRKREKIMRKAGLVDANGKYSFTLHDLRRSCATELARCGNSPKTVQKILGHASLETTMKYYVGCDDDDMVKAMRRREKTGTY